MIVQRQGGQKVTMVNDTGEKQKHGFPLLVLGLKVNPHFGID